MKTHVENQFCYLIVIYDSLFVTKRKKKTSDFFHPFHIIIYGCVTNQSTSMFKHCYYAFSVLPLNCLFPVKLFNCENLTKELFSLFCTD